MKDLKDRAENAKDKVVGTVKETFGKVTDNEQAQAEGAAQKASGNIKDKAQDVKEGVQDKAHDIKEGVQDKARDFKEGVEDKVEDVKEGMDRRNCDK